MPALNRRLGVVIGAGAAALVSSAILGALVPSRAAGGYAYAHVTTPLSTTALRPRLILPIALPTSLPTPALSPLPGVLALQDLTPDQALAANQAIPVSTLPNPAAKPFRMTEADDDDRARAQTCLTQAVYYEAGFEPLAGAQAVAQVVLNRLRHPIFPKTVCGVVFQGADLKTGCQFTFTCDGSMAKLPEPHAWARAQAVAGAALNGYVMKPVGEATHYHTQWVVPYWSPTLVKLTQIGAHIFYRWTGTFGQPPAFQGRYAGNEPGTPGAPLQIAALTPTPTAAVLSSATAQASATDQTSASPAAPSPSGADVAAPVTVAAFAAPSVVQPQAAPVAKITAPAPNYFGPPRSHPG